MFIDDSKQEADDFFDFSSKMRNYIGKKREKSLYLNRKLSP